MLRTLTLISTVIFLATVPLFAFDTRHSHFSAVLEIEPRKAVVGIPPSLRLTLTDQGSDARGELPKYALMRVTPANGDAFVAIFSAAEGEQFAGKLGFDASKSATKGKFVVDFPTTDITRREPWFVDRRWLVPGTYRAEVLLFDVPPVAGSVSVDNLESVLHVRATTNSVVFVVEEPSGDDAGVWNALEKELTATGPRDSIYWGVQSIQRVANEYIRLYPTSQYALYLASWLMAGSAEDRIKVWERLIAANSDNASVDEVWRYIAKETAVLSIDAILKGDTTGAIKWNEITRQHLSHLSKSDRPELSAWSRKKLAELPSAADLREQILEQEQPASDPSQ